MSEKTAFNDFATKEDPVYWRLESFEHELLDAIRDCPEGEGVLEAFGRFVRAPRGLLGDVDEASATSCRAHAHDRGEPGAAGAREADLHGYTRSLAALIAEERDDAATGRGAGSVEPWVVANALIGVHRALIDFARGLGGYGRE